MVGVSAARGDAAEPVVEFLRQQDRLSLQNPDQLLALHLVQYPGHGLARDRGIAGDLLVGQLDVDDPPPVVSYAVQILQAVQHRHDPLLGVVEAHDPDHHPGLAQLGAEHVDDVPAHVVVVLDEPVEVFLVQKSDLRVFHGDDRGRRRLAVQERHLAEEIPLPVDGQDLLAPVHVDLHHPDLAGVDDVHVVGRVLFEEHHLVPRDLPAPDLGLQFLQLRIGKPRKKGDAVQDLVATFFRWCGSHWFHSFPSLLPRRWRLASRSRGSGGMLPKGIART